MDREEAKKRWEKWRNQRNYYETHGAEEKNNPSNNTKMTIMHEIIGQMDRELLSSISKEPKKGELKLEK